MAKKFSELRAQMPQESRARADAMAKDMLSGMSATSPYDNVYADLGYPDAEEMLIKAQYVYSTSPNMTSDFRKTIFKHGEGNGRDCPIEWKSDFSKMGYPDFLVGLEP